MSRPGTPMLYNFLPVFADMRDGAFAPGGIETGIMAGAIAAMGRFYGAPTGGYLGLTNAKENDAQAGFEKAMAPLLAAVTGINYVVMGGLTDALMCLDYAPPAASTSARRRCRWTRSRPPDPAAFSSTRRRPSRA